VPYTKPLTFDKVRLTPASDFAAPACYHQNRYASGHTDSNTQVRFSLHDVPSTLLWPLFSLNTPMIRLHPRANLTLELLTLPKKVHVKDSSLSRAAQTI
jgi:hypothetical protein